MTVADRIDGVIAAPVTTARIGSVVFLDMSGYSQLSAQLLAAHGRRLGAEALHACVEQVFQRLDTLAHDNGGRAVSYAGDAGTYWFDALVLGGPQAAAQQAHWFCHAAAQLSEETPLRISLGSGQADETKLGHAALGALDLVSGPAIDAVLALDSIKLRPALLMCAVSAQLLDQSAESTTGGFVPDGSLARPPVVPKTRIPPKHRVPASLGNNHAPVLAEIRPVTALFVALRNSETTPAAQSVRIAAVQSAVALREGSVLNLNADDKGAYLSCVFGAPFAHESDGARALDTAIDVLGHFPDLSIGLAEGAALCGTIGPNRYDVIGEAMTRAARLMQAASPGQALVTAGLAQTQGARFSFDTASGAARLVARKTQLSDDKVEVLTERNGAMLALCAALAGAPPLCAVLEAPAGFGKTSLLLGLRDVSPVPDAVWLRGAGEDMSQDLPYHAWRPILSQVLGHGVPDAGDTAILSWAVGWTDTVPVALSALSGSERTARLAKATLDAIRHFAGTSPVVLCFDDAQWIDTPSYALMRVVFQQSGRMRLVLAKRPSAPPSMDAAMLIGDPKTRTIVLDRLSDAGVVALAASDLGATALSDELSRLFLERSGGSPLFVRQIARALLARDMVQIEDGHARVVVGATDLDRLDWLESVEAAIISGLDRLPAQVRNLARAASVHGRVFDERGLDAALGETARHHGVNLLDDLQQLVAEGVLVHSQTGYSFSHPVVQQAIAEGMTSAQRREIDTRLAAWWDNQISPEAVVRRARHLSNALPADETDPALLDRAVEALVAAAEGTAASDANLESAGFLADAIPLADRMPDTPAERRRRLNLRARYGYALSMFRGYGDPTVEKAYADALAYSEGVEDASDLSFTLYGMFSFYASRGDYGQAVGILRRMSGLAGPDQLPVLPSLLDHTRAILATLHGRPKVGAHLAKRSIDRADALGDGVYFVYANASDWRIFSGAWLALCLAAQGDWRGAEQAHTAALTLGENQRFAHAFVQGFCPLPVLARAPVAAQGYAQDLVADAGARGFALFGILGGIYRGWAQGSQGVDSAEVNGALNMQLSISRAMKLDSFNIWYSALAAEARLALGDIQAARDEVTAGYQALARGGSSIFEGELLRADAQVTLAEGNADAAADLIDRAHTHGLARGSLFFAFLAAEQGARLLPGRGFDTWRDARIAELRTFPAPSGQYDGPVALIWPKTAISPSHSSETTV